MQTEKRPPEGGEERRRLQDIHAPAICLSLRRSFRCLSSFVLCLRPQAGLLPALLRRSAHSVVVSLFSVTAFCSLLKNFSHEKFEFFFFSAEFNFFFFSFLAKTSNPKSSSLLRLAVLFVACAEADIEADRSIRK